MKRIRSVIFDFDGTLADSRVAIKQAFLKSLKDVDAPIPLEPYFNEICSRALVYMFAVLGVVDPKRLLKSVSQYHRHYKAIGPRNIRLYSGVMATLNTLSEFGFSLALGTNEIRDNLENLFPALDIRQYFTTTVCGDEVSYPKPHPEMAHRILDEMGSYPSETLMVGDSVSDIEVGKATGCHTCGVTYGTHPEEKLRLCSPDWIIHQPTDLLGILGLPPFPGSIQLREQRALAFSPKDAIKV